MLITGNRGCGKTVLLRELQRLASERGWAVFPIPLRLAYATAWPRRFARINRCDVNGVRSVVWSDVG
ncbi:MAG: hypothetical protein ACLU0O_06195 [Collinsella sp.]